MRKYCLRYANSNMKCSGQAEEPVNRDKRGQWHYTFYRTGLIHAFFSLHLVFPIRSYHIFFCTETSLVVPVAILAASN